MEKEKELKKEENKKREKEDKWTGEMWQGQSEGQERQHRRMRGSAKAYGQEVRWLWQQRRQRQHSRQTPSLPLMLPPRGHQPAEAVKVIYLFSRLVRFALDILRIGFTGRGCGGIVVPSNCPLVWMPSLCTPHSPLQGEWGLWGHLLTHGWWI